MPETDPLVQAQVGRLVDKVIVQAKTARRLDRYYEGSCPMPQAVKDARVTKAYRLLMPLAEAPWGSLIVQSKQDRLEVAGLQVPEGDEAARDAIWGVWQDNHMDAESSLAHNAALIAGRAYALVWRTEADPQPVITLESAEQFVVEYVEGSRRHRTGALRYWTDDDDRAYATLYRREAAYKFQEAKTQNDGGDRFKAAGKFWEPRMDDGEENWPLENPWGVVPGVEIPVNQRLKAGRFGYARGEFEHCVGLIDRINLLTFLGLVVAFWMGFPLRGVIGEKIIRDDDGEPIAPFDVHADKVAQLENPEASIFEYKAADRKNLSVFAELDQLATVSTTPRHYFPLEQGMSNIAADTIRANEGAMHATVRGRHKPSLGGGWLEVMRLCGLMHDDSIQLSPRAQVIWADHESRSLAERADAASKLKDILPWQAVAEMALQANQDQIMRWEGMRTGDALAQLVAAATQPSQNAAA